MKERNEMCSLWKRSVQWDKMTAGQKWLSVWFSLSIVGLVFCGEGLLPTAIALANFASAAYFTVRNVPMEDE